MNLRNTYGKIATLPKFLLAAVLVVVGTAVSHAEIVIGNNVYGGGEGSTATVKGNATVNVTEGVIKNNVFGGAYMANVEGYAFVNVLDNNNGKRPVVASVYGGNDIAGNILNSKNLKPYDYSASLPLAYVPNAFVRVLQNSANGPFVGELYGGGNGDYVYSANASDNSIFDVQVGTNVYSVASKPDMSRTLVDVLGGTVGHMYGGGKNATVTASADIWFHENDTIAPATIDASYLKLYGDSGFMDIPEGFTLDPTDSTVTFDYQVTRMFGGNNLTEMSIQPTWHLVSGRVNKLYSGGNRGDMTTPGGIVLTLNSDSLEVGTVFGGCRLADVNPGKTNGTGNIPAMTVDGYTFAAGQAAKLNIRAGKIGNVYGGNDIAGNVYFGTEVAIQSDIIGDVYGGGNGSYPYTNNPAFSSSDYYYDVKGKTGTDALGILNSFRPNCENALLHIFGGTSSNPVYVGGNVYCGGNSATLKKIGGGLGDANARLKLGSNVIINNLFLGSNGEDLVGDSIIDNFNDATRNLGIDLTDKAQFDKYMESVEVSIKPAVSIDSDYDDYSTYIGSLYCGGNLGCMTAEGTFTIDFLNTLVIFDKLVAGCNDANVPYKEGKHSYHLGGLTTHADTKVELNIAGLLIEPKLLEYDAANDKFNFTWNKIEAGKRYGSNGEIDGDQYAGFMYGGNIYGGCFKSGHIDGDVKINITENTISSALYAEMMTLRDAQGDPLLDGSGNIRYGLNDRDWDQHVYEPLLSTVTCYGGGYGDETEIWGNTEINVKNLGHILKARAGSERGWVGKMVRDSQGRLVKSSEKYRAYYYNDSTKYAEIDRYEVAQAYDATVHIDAELLKDPTFGNIYNNVGEVVAGGFEGVVTGNTHAIIDNGCMYTVFGGASNAHIYGGSEVILGKNGFPYVSQTVYGGNDFGGQIMGTMTHNTGNTASGSIKTVKSNAYVEYIQGEIGYGTGETVTDTTSVDFGIFGGAYGYYDYRYHPKYQGVCKSQPNMMAVLDKGDADLAVNCFVNISSKSTKAEDKIKRVYGGGQGFPGQKGLACANNTYVLLNARNSSDRGGNKNYIAQYVYGGGDCSFTRDTRVDVYGTYTEALFGACRGRGLDDIMDDGNEYGNVPGITYQGETSSVNLYSGLSSPLMDVFGAGAYSGVRQSTVNLFGGEVHDVYGASYNEGITYLAQVNVPSSSKSSVNAIFGGGMGNNAKNICDTYISHIIYDGADATVADAVYGGNNAYRLTGNSFVDISVPVLNSEGEPVDVYGAGKGVNTMAMYTNVNMLSGALADNVYGGGQYGSVFNAATLTNYIEDQDYFGDDILTQCTDASGFNAWKATKTSSINGIVPSELDNIALDKSATPGAVNTHITLNQGSMVNTNVYGAGYGTGSVIAGQTQVDLLGATVNGNIYGGGYGGDVMAKYDDSELDGYAQVYSTNVNLTGGSVSNSYGGGYNGDVVGSANTVAGLSDCGKSPVTYLSGDPSILQSIYGGGENGAVEGLASTTIYNGHIGYKYDESVGSTKEEHYLTNVDLITAKDSILEHNGNVFGGGYGEDAKTANSYIGMYGGTIRGSLYGGGEIASIGHGTVDLETDNPVPPLKAIQSPGSTEVYMYGGHVQRNVFGGGRGYSYDYKGNQVIGTRFYTDGYVFGPTAVYIRGGEIGTVANVEKGYGNVFGGGDVGFVYSAYGTRQTAQASGRTVGYYYDNSKSGNVLTEDCKVVVSPYAKVLAAGGVTVNGHSYSQCEYVPTEDLNTLLGKESTDKFTWEKLDYLTGVTIRNAIFAGGNVTQGDDKLYANTVTVHGNATATMNDIYHRDLITIGSENTGGLYGDGNLTLVDGYRELCIINYGTDYYGLKQRITKDEYDALNDRERAYFQLMYECKKKYDKYELGQTVTEEVYKIMSDDEHANWELAGFCSVYAGRLLNTIQRADFVGVHGSRIVLQGAQDRVIDVMDYMDYAINRVGEVSLNQRASVVPSGELASEQIHGNYLGMYNVVNYLEALTSDVRMSDDRQTNSADHPVEELYRSYEAYKQQYNSENFRNNGTSANKVALASGIFLELVSSESTEDNKIYGPITGVIELDLMDIGKDMGGAFVYAKNIHGTRSGDMNIQAILSPYNTGARTNRGYVYADDANEIETSGNFVHSTKQIIDDCYPGSADLSSPAHYWFLRGNIYVYDQYISAHTGSSTAYKADTQIPLTITAGSHGKLSIMTIQANLYAYYKSFDAVNHVGEKLGADEKVVVNGKTYHLNDVITYWDWSNLTPTQQNLFVHDTYIVTEGFKYRTSGTDSVAYVKNDVILPAEFASIPPQVVSSEGTVGKSTCIHMSNATSHETGYVLTADITNPLVWDDRYILKQGNNIITTTQYESLSAEDKAKYIAGPSYRTESGVFGQYNYFVDDIISDEVFGAYDKIPQVRKEGLTNQAVMQDAYIVTERTEYNFAGNKGVLEQEAAISKSWRDSLVTYGDIAPSKFDVAYLCNSTGTVKGRYYLTGDIVSETFYNTLDASEKTMFSKAHICTTAGKFGGTWYEGDVNYDALEAWCSLSAEDRDNVTFNYDALDLFVNNLDPEASIAQYDSVGKPYYSLEYSIEYEAICHTPFSYQDKSGTTVNVVVNDTLVRADYEKIPNEKIHYSLIDVKGDNVTMLVVNTAFVVGDVPYSVGQTIENNEYNSLSAELQSNITQLHFDNLGKYYYCKEEYEVNENGSGHNVTNFFGGTSYTSGQQVAKGTVISESDYVALPNYQSNMRITGTSPIETSTLYVARDANMYDVLKDRIVTLIYKYQFEESNVDGSDVTTVTERHVVNIHLEFKSGAPAIGTLKMPGAVLPGTAVGLKQPSVTKGAYEIIGGGWEIYSNESDAVNHTNGTPYKNNQSHIYFYQDGSYVAYYAKTYLGKTYSNAVPFTVANYHDINDVMADTENYMYIDHIDVKRNPKIYISDDEFQDDASKSELDLLRDLFDTSLDAGKLDPRVKGLANLDFILESDVAPKHYTTWTPLGDDTDCFGENGFFHGDGHTVTGLDHSLFGTLCASVHNLGVMGSFTEPGIANKGGSAYNSWVWTTGTPASGTNAVMGTGLVSNCYYPETNAYNAGGATAKPERAFMNGEVAFNLNGYYLGKRYTDQLASVSSPVEYKYYTQGTGNALTLHTGKYENADAIFTVPNRDAAGNVHHILSGYVESRFADGDFLNAGGRIPTTKNERMDDYGNYYPIWPDDYIFFGQNLTYGLVEGSDHQEKPSAINKATTGHLLKSGMASNRVLRAPAYYGNTTMGVVHFNSNAIMPAEYTQVTDTATMAVRKLQAYPGMTAVDFTATNDATKYSKGMSNVADHGIGGVFYTPVLDYSTLSGFGNNGQTQNMLVYADKTNDAASYKVLEKYLYEPEYTVVDGDYDNVEKVANTDVSSVRGHLLNGVKGGSFTAERSQFLVDKQTFNAPFAYGFDTGKFMWYQRTPDVFVGADGGWETLALPFTVELVSTQDKGEITHFYTGSKTGHEYWLREYKGKSPAAATAGLFHALLKSPDADASASNHEVSNDFLWDYYYSKSSDSNQEDYIKYYWQDRTYNKYPTEQYNTPYIIGFPGARYREFDLSGTFVPGNTLNSIPALAKQTVTFKGKAGSGIGVTDTELATAAVSQDGYQLVPTFKDIMFMATDAGYYAMNPAGSKFDQVQDSVQVLPFRAYFMAGGKAAKAQTRSILFTMGDEDDAPEIEFPYGLTIYAKDGCIIIESGLEAHTDVRIVNAAGQTVTTVTVAPGQRRVVPVAASGLYLANDRKVLVMK